MDKMKKITINICIALTLILLTVLIIFNMYPLGLIQLTPHYIDYSKANTLKDTVQKVIDSDYIFLISTDKNQYSPFERIKLESTFLDKKTKKIPSDIKMTVTITDKKTDENILFADGKKEEDLIFNSLESIFTKNIYLPYYENYNEIVLNLHVHFRNGKEAITQKYEITINHNDSFLPISKGLSFIGVESKESIENRSMISPENEEVSSSILPTWISLLNADGVFVLGGITKTFDQKATSENPWDIEKTDEIENFASSLSKVNKSIGVWAQALLVEGTFSKKLGYETAWYIEHNKLETTSTWVSYQDEKRLSDIQELLEKWNKDTSIKYIGLSDLITPDHYNQEMVEDFLTDTSYSLDKDWKNFTLHEKLNLFQDKTFIKNFDNWKYYQIKIYLEKLLKDLPKNKPLFYSINLSDIIQKPFLVDLLLGNYIDFLVVKISGNLNTLQNLKELEFFTKYSSRIIIEYEIDYKTLKNDSARSIIENYTYNTLYLSTHLNKKQNIHGIVIGDLYNAMFTKRGAFSPYEWMLGIGNTIFEFQKLYEVPKLDISAYTDINMQDISEEILYVKLTNNSGHDIHDLKLSLLPLLENYTNEEYERKITLLPDGQTRVFRIPFVADFEKSMLDKNIEFLGFHISYQENNEHKQHILYSTVPVIQSEEKP